MVNLNRIYRLVLSDEDICKTETSGLLFEMNPASDAHFRKAVELLRKRKNYRIQDFEKESGLLRALLIDFKRRLETDRLSAPSEEILKEGRRLNSWTMEIASDKEINELRRQFDIPSAWHHSIRDYIISGRMPNPTFKCRIVFKQSYLIPEGEMWLEFDGETTLKNIIHPYFWVRVEGYKQHLSPGSDETKKRFRKHTPLKVKTEGGKILVSIHLDTTQATVKRYWKKLKIPRLQKEVLGKRFKWRKGLGHTSLKLLRGEKVTTNPESERIYRHRLRKRGLIE